MIQLIFNTETENPIAFSENVGVSDIATEIQREAVEVKNHFARSITFGEHLSRMLEGLFQVKNECSIDNWDGYDAKAIDNESFQNAIRFALSLTPNIPIPEIYVDPDGEVTFEWYEDKRKVFSVSVGSKNKLSYAGLYGFSKAYGVEYFYYDTPKIILNNIYRLYTE
jgi:hypothetical protein